MLWILILVTLPTPYVCGSISKTSTFMSLHLEHNYQKKKVRQGETFASSQMFFCDSSGLVSPSVKVNTVSMSRTFSSPGIEGSIDRPMRLAEIYVAAEHALQNTISAAELWTSLSSVEEFEVIDFQALYSFEVLYYVTILRKCSLISHKCFYL